MADDDQLARLIEQSATGDREAFRTLYDLTASRLMGATMRILGRSDMAEDALQEAYLSIWERAGTYRREVGAPLAWMSTIARRRAIDRLRASPWLKREAPEDEGAAIVAAAVGGPDADMLTLKECLGRLEQRALDAILSAYLYGMSHRELALAKSMPLGTVKSMIRRAALQLKRCLGE